MELAHAGEAREKGEERSRVNHKSHRPLIGVAKTCYNMTELRDKMAEMYGKAPVRMTLYLPPPRYRIVTTCSR